MIIPDKLYRHRYIFNSTHKGYEDEAYSLSADPTDINEELAIVYDLPGGLVEYPHIEDENGIQQEDYFAYVHTCGEPEPIIDRQEIERLLTTGLHVFGYDYQAVG